jgi:predicted TIM-barrel fold metal-dependent hydrolase
VLFATDFPFIEPVAHVAFLREHLPSAELEQIRNHNRLPFREAPAGR